MAEVSLGWDLSRFQLHWGQTASAVGKLGLRCRDSAQLRRGSCKSEHPFPFNWGNGFAAIFWWGNVCARRVMVCRDREQKFTVPCRRWSGVIAAGPSRCVVPDVQCSLFLVSASALWQTDWWSRFEDKVSPGVWGWDLSDTWLWCLHHETCPSLYFASQSCMSLLDGCSSYINSYERYQS